MRPSDTWVCVADGYRARFYRCDPGQDPEPILEFGLPAASRSGPGFVGRLACQLERAANDRLYRHLVLVAPQSVLNELDGSLSADARNAVIGTLDRPLAGATPRELVRHLGDLLPH
jgi:protein required for attachment to host cells